MNRAVLFFFFSFFTNALIAQTGYLAGTVKDSEGQPVPFATVVIEGTDKSASTNESGKYSIPAVPAGTVTLKVYMTGLEPASQQVTVKENETTSADITMPQSSRQIGEVVITGQKRRVSSATKTNTNLQDLPISIQLIDKELMQQQLITDTRDAIKNVSGINVLGTHKGGFVFYTARGFWMTNWSNFRRNGMMIWNMGHHHNDNIEQVEILKGPASVLYGDVAPGAVMNFVTKKPLRYDYKRFELRAGQYGLIRPTVDVSGPLDKKGNFLYRLNATYERSNSFRDVVKNETSMLSPALTWTIHPRLVWDVEGVYKADDRISDPGLISPDGTFEGVKKLPINTFLGETNSPYVFRDRNLFSTLTFYLTDSWKIRNQSYYTSTNRSATTIHFASSPDSAGNTDRYYFAFHQYWKGWGNNFDVIGELRTGQVKHHVLIGFDYMINEGKYTDGPFELLDSAINIFNPRYGLSVMSADPMKWVNFKSVYARTGIYVQDQLSAFDGKLQALIGARYNISRQGNEYDTKQDEPENYFIPVDKLVSPRAGLVYKPVRQLSIYGSYSQSYEMNGVDWIDPAIAIDPTDATQIEFGAKSSLANDRLGVTVAAFQIDKKDIYGWVDAITRPTISYVAWDSLGEYATYQGGHHQSKGIEMDVSGKLFEQLTINATYAYIKAYIIEDPAYESGKELLGNARNSASLWVNYAFGNALKGLELGYGAYFKDKFYMSNLNLPEELVNTYYSMDASAAYTYKNFTTRVNVTNLTNTIGYTGGKGMYEPLWVRRVIGSLAVKF